MQPALREGIDYTLDEQGRFVFTREFLLARGTCCKSGCRNCPYGYVDLKKLNPDIPT